MTDNTESPSRSFRIEAGFPPSERRAAARLFWLAFKGKLGRVLGPETKGLAFLEDCLDPAYCLSALAADGSLLGLAGYKTAKGGFVGGDLTNLRRTYGTFGGVWRGLVLVMLEREPTPDLLLMDGIFVDPKARGQGVGSALLAAIADTARTMGLHGVRLDVIDTNPRARALYERQGFVPVRTQSVGPLRWLFGFSSATEMHLPLRDAP